MDTASNNRAFICNMKKLLILLILVGFSSCGAKKKLVQKSKTVEKKDLVISKTDSISTDIQIKKILESLVIEPVNPNVLQRVTFQTKSDTFTIIGNNTRIFHKKETTDSVVQKVQVKDSSVVDKSEKESKVTNKNIESEGWNWKGLNWFVLLIILLLAGWIFYRIKVQR